MVMEPALSVMEESELEAAGRGDVDRDEHEFLWSLFPISRADRLRAAVRAKKAAINGLGMGLDAVRPPKRRKVICNEFVFISPEGDAVAARSVNGRDGDGGGGDEEMDRHPPGTLRVDGERHVMGGRVGSGSGHHLMLRI